MALPAPVGQSLQHEALFYDDDRAVLGEVEDFVREGLDHGETVLVRTGVRPVNERLWSRFADHSRVKFVSAASCLKPVAALDHHRRLMDEGLGSGAPGYRSVGGRLDPDTVLPWGEWVRYESIFNSSFATYPLRALCLFDTLRETPELIQAMRETHPCSLESGGSRPVKEYVEPDELFAGPDYLPTDDPIQSRRPTIEVGEVGGVAEARIAVYPAAMESPLRRRTVDDFVTAVGEVVENATVHAGGVAGIRLWSGKDRLVCTVTDHGGGILDPMQGYIRPRRGRPGGGVSQGLGLWAARQLCDIVDYGHDEAGFTVRLVAFERG